MSSFYSHFSDASISPAELDISAQMKHECSSTFDFPDDANSLASTIENEGFDYSPCSLDGSTGTFPCLESGFHVNEPDMYQAGASPSICEASLFPSSLFTKPESGCYSPVSSTLSTCDSLADDLWDPSTPLATPPFTPEPMQDCFLPGDQLLMPPSPTYMEHGAWEPASPSDFSKSPPLMQEDESHFAPCINETSYPALNEKAPHWPIELILQRSKKTAARKGKARDCNAPKQRQASPTSAVAGAKVSKPLKRLRTSSQTSHVSEKKRKETVDSEKCRFECIFAHYGCGRVFRCKNEWKRHINTQHLELEQYLCDIGVCSKNSLRMAHGESVHIFNRKDLFTSHLRRHHDPGKPSSYSGPLQFNPNDPAAIDYAHDAFEIHLQNTCNRCYMFVRNPPAHTTCRFCDMEIDHWGRMLEHIGQHLEKEDEPLHAESLEFRNWAIMQRILVPGENQQATGEIEWVLAEKPKLPHQSLR